MSKTIIKRTKYLNNIKNSINASWVIDWVKWLNIDKFLLELGNM